MKGKKGILAMLLALAIMLLAGCQEAQQTADLRILLDESGSRILTPKDPADFKVEKYHVICQERGKANPIELESIRSSFVIQDLPIGEYTIEATGRNAAGDDIVRGSTTFSLSHTNTTATVVLSELIGQGNVNISFTWDGNLITEPSVKVTLSPRDGQSVEAVTETLAVSNNSASFTRSGLPAGSYTIVAELFDGETKVAGCVEALRIGQNSTVNGSVSFDLDELPSSVGNITLENQAGIPIECRIIGLENEAAVEAQREIVVSLDTSGLEESGLAIEWYLDGSFLGKGKEIRLTPQPGSHRLDVVASTSKLGSTGSTQINFEAALLGEAGMPVLGALVSTDDGISLSADMVFDFLQDGRLLVIDNSTYTAQICSLVRNTLRVEGSQTLQQRVIDIATSDSTKVVLAFEDGSSAVYSYNMATARLQNPMSNDGWIREEDQLAYKKIYGLAPSGSYCGYEDTYAVFSTIDYLADDDPAHDNLNVIGFHDKSDAEATKIAETMVFFDNKFNGDCEIFALSANGREAVLIDQDTGFTAMWGDMTLADGTKRNLIRKETISYANVSAAVPLPMVDSGHVRMVVADGDNLIIYEAENESPSAAIGFDEVATLMRSEGSELNTVHMLVDSSESFLYTLNQGNDSLSTYRIESDGQLTYIGMSDLTFTPSKATVSANGEFMIVLGNDGELALMRVRTDS